MEFLGGILFMIGILGLIFGEPYFLFLIPIGWIIMQCFMPKNSNKGNQSEEKSLSYNNNLNTEKNKAIQPNRTEKTMEVYVIVKFDNYGKQYTYLAPENRFLHAGDRVKIMTKDGSIKHVTVVKGNHKCPIKNDMKYSRLKIVGE